MTVRDVLEPMVIDGMLNARDLAPKIEAALESAAKEMEYQLRFTAADEKGHAGRLANGVTAGIEALSDDG